MESFVLALTPGTLTGYLDAFATYVDASNWTSAEIELVKAETVLQSLPNTEQASWRGTLDTAWAMLKSIRDREDATTGMLIHSAHRRKTRSTRSDGT